jgi:ABC-2 type transport system permease protein
MAGRMMKHMTRSVDTIITVVLMPVLLLLMFVYVLGGAMELPTGVDYKAFIVPGILLFCVASGTSYTAFRLNNDVTKGIFERFHSMPIAKSSVLNGHAVTGVVFNGVSVLIVLLIAMLIGFRPQAGLTQWLLAAVLMFLFVMAFTWIAIFFGLLSKNAEMASVFTYPVMALIFVSSAFAPTSSMPAGLRAFADIQPMTPIINACRSLLSDGIVTNDLWGALLWCVGLWAAFQGLSVWVYHRKMK